MTSKTRVAKWFEGEDARVGGVGREKQTLWEDAIERETKTPSLGMKERGWEWQREGERERERECRRQESKKWKKKEKQNTKRENAKLSQGYFVGRTAMGYFQSQNYTKERLSSTLQQQSQQDSAAAPTSRTPHHTLEALIRRDNSISAFCLCITHPGPIFYFFW